MMKQATLLLIQELFCSKRPTIKTHLNGCRSYLLLKSEVGKFFSASFCIKVRIEREGKGREISKNKKIFLTSLLKGDKINTIKKESEKL